MVEPVIHIYDEEEGGWAVEVVGTVPRKIFRCFSDRQTARQFGMGIRAVHDWKIRDTTTDQSLEDLELKRVVGNIVDALFAERERKKPRRHNDR